MFGVVWEVFFLPGGLERMIFYVGFIFEICPECAGRL